MKTVLAILTPLSVGVSSVSEDSVMSSLPKYQRMLTAGLAAATEHLISVSSSVVTNKRPSLLSTSRFGVVG